MTASAVMMVLATLVGCGDERADSLQEPIETEEEVATLPDQVNAPLDEARAVEDLALERKAAMDAAIDGAVGEDEDDKP
ncbi:MAG: hypothetical protein AAGF46_00575 [Pseudomonadota bacterium]